MAQAVKIQNSEEALLNAVIAKVREGQYEILDIPNGYSLSGKVILTETVLESGTRRIQAQVGDKTFTGKFVRRLEKAIHKSLEGPKAKGGKPKVLKTEDELAQCWELI